MRLKPNNSLWRRERGVRLREFAFPGIAGLVVLVILFIWAGNENPYQASGPHEFPAFRDIELKVKRKALWFLRFKREQALEEEVLIQGPNDWVEGALIENDQQWPVKLRLKGDWTDHLKQGKWSFRVQVKDSLTFHRLKVFSLQSPRTRSFLDEWHFHQTLLQEKVLTTRYDFVRLHFNGAELGVYAIEEHFTKELIEYNGHREGPLLKLNEDGLWEARKVALADPDLPFVDLPLYEAAHPEAFNYNDLLKEDAQVELHTQAQALLHAYKYGLKPTSELFDLRNTARAYALIDLFRAHHSLVWHNRRFYYEPIHARLQPIIYDAFSGDVSGQYLNGPFTGYASNGNTFYDGRIDLLGTRFFAEDEFITAYYEYLHQYTAPQYLDSLSQKLGESLVERMNFLRREYLFYQYPPEKLQGYADEIRSSLVIDPELLEFNTEDGLCVKNLNPVPVLVDTGSNGRAVLLDAYDGRNLAEHLQLPDSLSEIRCRIPGGEPQLIAIPTVL